MQTIGVVGAGTMGRGIAQVAATAGYQVQWWDAVSGQVAAGKSRIYDLLEKRVAQGKLDASSLTNLHSRLEPVAELSQLANCELVVEAIPEQLELKRQLFQTLETIVTPNCILATNTSSLSIAAISSPLQHPERLIGTHFFNPVPLMVLLEIVVHPKTATEVLAATTAFGRQLGKEVITVNDFPGFASSRLGVCLGMEAIRMVEQGVASPEDIDKAMVLGYRHPVGPLRLTDMVGLDVRMNIGSYLAVALQNPAFEPPELMKRMVQDGLLGQKSGKGFYTWDS